MPPPSHPQHPSLQPSLCLQTDSLRAFLRLSRAAIDDPISQHLSSISQPSQHPFDPASFSAARSSAPTRRALPAGSCAAFVSHTLFPAWAARARVLEYCAGVAEAQNEDGSAGQGDRGDAGASRRRNQWGGTIKGGTVAIGAGVVGPEAQGQRRDAHSPTTTLVQEDEEGMLGGRQRVVDERLDPYSARDYYDETAGERVARVVREEKSVERIVRARSWGLVRDRCGSAVDDWEDGMRRWEVEMNRVASVSAEGRAPEQSESKASWKALWSS